MAISLVVLNKYSYLSLISADILFKLLNRLFNLIKDDKVKNTSVKKYIRIK
ncbi:hypothetical protein D3C81_2292730 [compost metagenome]